MFPSLSTLGNIVAETFENCYVSSNVSQFVHPGKHCCGNIWELLCFLECFPVCPPWETLLRKHLRIAMFPRMFSSLSTLGNIVEETFENCYVSSNVSQFVHPGKHCCGNIWELLCFLECFPVCPPWETLLRKHLRFFYSFILGSSPSSFPASCCERARMCSFPGLSRQVPLPYTRKNAQLSNKPAADL